MPADLQILIAGGDPAIDHVPQFGPFAAWVLMATVIFIVLHLLVVGLRGGKKKPGRPAWSGWQKLVYLGTVFSVAILGFTAFYAVIRFQVLDGWLLFAHMFGAGAFTAILPLLALTWCPDHCFAERQPVDDEPRQPFFFWLPKLTFWIVLAAGIVVTGTMLLSMLPLFGTDGLHVLLDLHRYSGLAVVVALLLHLYSVLLQRARLE